MASKKSKFSIENKLTNIDGASYKDILLKVLTTPPEEGLNTSEMNDRIIVINSLNEDVKKITFKNGQEVVFMISLLSKFKFPFLSEEVILLQNELSTLKE